jgi:hypothetical protein
MNSFAQHLAADEEVICRTRLHPIALVGTATFALFVAGVVALIVSRNELTLRAIGYLCLGGLVAVLLGSFTALRRWRLTEFAVTPRRLLVRSGRRAVQGYEARTLSKVEVGETWLGRRLDYGTIDIADAQGPLASFRSVNHARALREALLRQVPSRARARAR